MRAFLGETKTVAGAELVIDTLKRLGVETVFGYPGGAILPIYDALYGSGIRHVLTRHEQAAIHAAEGYARATGKVGTVLATSGPGATNLVTGLADAHMDSVPLVAITGQVATSLIGTDGFQEADVIGITLPITKYSYQVRHAEDLPRVLAEAYALASSGRPGPVLIDIPKDVSSQRVAVSADGERPNGLDCMAPKNPVPPLDLAQVKRISQAMEQADRPVLYIGGGVIHAEAASELRQLVRKTGIPVVSTLMGLGAFPGDDPLFLGMLGMHGTFAANRAVHEADLLIACGVRFDDRVTGKLERFSPRSEKVHIDIDPAEIGKNVEIHYPLVADVKAALQALLHSSPKMDIDAWVYRVKGWKKDYPLMYEQKAGQGLKPQFVIDCLNRLTRSRAIVTTEVGQHQMWAAHFYQAKEPRTFITSGGLGTMGFGFPAAMGAQIAKPDAQVICIAGDASFQMNIQELQTVAERNLPVKVFVINNRYMGMVRQWQEMFYENRLSESGIGAPDFVKVAEAYGVKGLRACTPEEAERAMEMALSHPGPAVVDFVVEEEENVFPMVPPGKGNDQMLMKGWEE